MKEYIKDILLKHQKDSCGNCLCNKNLTKDEYIDHLADVLNNSLIEEIDQKLDTTSNSVKSPRKIIDTYKSVLYLPRYSVSSVLAIDLVKKLDITNQEVSLNFRETVLLNNSFCLGLSQIADKKNLKYTVSKNWGVLTEEHKKILNLRKI